MSFIKAIENTFWVSRQSQRGKAHTRLRELKVLLPVIPVILGKKLCVVFFFKMFSKTWRLQSFCIPLHFNYTEGKNKKTVAWWFANFSRQSTLLINH